ncbi:MAG: hypothetical protein KC736_03315 [Candidatus Moranbacteria bacterium]|nr:hypothetical protein [Candidatus Moranbacteria bacterium]
MLAREKDEQYADRRYSSPDFVKGKGSLEDPYRYKSAAPVSAYYAIIDLWSRFCKKKQKTFIRVNKWIMEVKAHGVQVVGGNFIRLV